MSRLIRRVARHPIVHNVIALYWLQLATFVVPLITIPYLARVLLPSAFGLVVFSQGVAFVLMTFINWGFPAHAVRAVAAKREDPEQLSDAVARVRGAQLLLAAASMPIALTMLVFVPKLAGHPEFLVLAWIAAVAGGLSPGWFFLGIEKMRLNTLIQVSFRFVAAALTLLLVNGAEQAWVVMALFAASLVGSWIASDVMMYRRVRFRVPRLRQAVSETREAAMLFVASVATALYTAFNVVLLGLFEPSAAVAQFGAAERLVRVSFQVLGPLGVAVYPRLAALQASGRRKRAHQLLTIAVAAAAIPALLVAGALALFAPLVIEIVFGPLFVHASVPILRVLVLIIPIGVIGAVASMWLVSLHQDRRVAEMFLAAGLVNVAAGCVLTPLFGPIGMAWSVIIAETTATSAGIIIVLRSNRLAGAGRDQCGIATERSLR